jgi:hypothetical protein
MNRHLPISGNVGNPFPQVVERNVQASFNEPDRLSLLLVPDIQHHGGGGTVLKLAG